MKQIATVILAIAALYFAGCSKRSTIPAVNGTINGIPARSLYGTSGNSTDYMLILTGSTAAYRQLSYTGENYAYTYIPGTSDIFITIAPSYLVRATLDTASRISLIIQNPPQANFLSAAYYSR